MGRDLIPEDAQTLQAVLWGIPAMIAAVIAPIEIPATQSGKYSEDAKAS
jgi:hypothetical protein